LADKKQLAPAQRELPGAVARKGWLPMQNERTQASSPVRSESDEIESLVLLLLLDGTNQRPWSASELGREFGDPDKAAVAVASLHASGLVHLIDGFVFATRAAVRANELAL
jgi:NaMN:DMB phosphoribosyltransferase